jgi:hypothetical protein
VSSAAAAVDIVVGCCPYDADAAADDVLLVPATIYLSCCKECIVSVVIVARMMLLTAIG